MLPARTVNGATGVFYGPREHPNIFQGTGQHWLIFQENKGINLILGGIGKWQFGKLIFFYALAIRIRYCPSAIAVFGCFINIQKDADERKLTQAGRTNNEIYAPNLRYVLCTQIPTNLYAHGEWECLQSKLVNCCHTTSWKGWIDLVGSLVLFIRACRKSTNGFSHAPLKTAFSLHRGNTAWPPRLFQLPVIIASNFTCSKVIFSGDFYHGNAGDPPARVKPPWDTKI